MKRLAILAILPMFIHAKSVDFEMALNLALENNKELKAKKLSIDKAKTKLDSAKSLDFGEIKVNEEFSYTNNAMYVFANKLGSREATFRDFGFSDFLANQENPNLLDIEPNDLNYPSSRKSFDTTISYEVPIFTGFKLTHAKEIAKLQLKAERVKYQRDEKLLGFEVLKSYNGAVASKYFIDAITKAKSATESFVKLSTALFNEGIVTKIDVLQAKERDLQVNAQMIEAKSRYNLALAYLRFLTSSEEVDNVKDFKNIKCNKKLSLSGLKDSATSSRLDLKWMEFNTKSAKSKVKFDESSYYPTIGLQAKYGFNDDRLSLDSDKDYYVVGLGINYTLFDGGKRNAIKEEAKIDYQKANLNLEHMRRGVELEVETNYLNLQTKREIINEKVKSKELAIEVLEKASEMYKNGLINMSELLLKEAGLHRARAELIQAKYDETISAARLKLSIGENCKGW